MKNVFLILFSAVLVGAISSCNSDSGSESCDTVVCQNGGTCDDGTCECPTGFTGEFCQTVDNSGPITINSTVQFNGTVNGTSYSFVSGQGSFQPYTGSAGYWGTNGELSQKQYTGGVLDFFTNVSAGVSKGNLQITGNSPTLAQMQALWAVGTYNYTADAVNGVGVEFSPDGTTFWTTSNGAGTQPGTSSFEITHVGSSPSFVGEITKVRVEATCVLYDDNGNSANLEGVFVMTIDQTL